MSSGQSAVAGRAELMPGTVAGLVRVRDALTATHTANPH